MRQSGELIFGHSLSIRRKNNSDSFLIREQYDSRNQFSVRRPQRQIRSRTLSWKLVTLAERCGVRQKEQAVEGGPIAASIRKEVSIAHGFRKFFTTQLINSIVNPEIRQMLLGHKIGLASCYYRPTEEEMLQEYMKAVNNLTINEENRLNKKLAELEKTQDEISLLKMKHEKEINERRQLMEHRFNQTLEKIDVKMA